MHRLYYEGFTSNRRDQLISQCIQAIHEGKEVYYILPSREAMFDVRKKMINQGGGIFKSKIFGLNDFERLILGESVKGYKEILPVEQRMLIKQILTELLKENMFFPVKDKPGFIELLLSTIRKFKRLNLTPEDLLTVTSDLSRPLKQKCADVQSIFNQYEQYKSQKCLYDENDYAMKAIDIVKASEYFKKPTLIVIDGFINIDPVNKALIQAIEKHSDLIDIIINVPFRNLGNEDFLKYEILNDFEHYERLLEDVDHNTLAQKIYGSTADTMVDRDKLEIMNSPCVDYEVRSVAKACKQLMIDEKVKDSELMITITDDQTYRTKLINIFKEYGLSINIKEKTNLVDVPVIKDLLAFWGLLDIEEESKALKTVITSKYLVPIDLLKENDYETDSLEQKYNLTNIRLDDLISQCMEEIEKDSEHNPFGNGTTQSLVNYLKRCKDYSEACNLDKIKSLEAYLNLISRLKVEERINLLYAEKLIDQQRLIKDLMALKSFKVVFSKLKDMVKFLGNAEFENGQKGFVREIKEILMEIELKNPRRNTNGIKVMPPDLIRGLHFHTVFALGMNEGSMPKKTTMSSLFNQNELKELYDCGVNLGLNHWELEREKIRFNCILASASEKLFLSYRTADEDGSMMIPSSFLDYIMAILSESSKEKVVLPQVTMRKRLKYSEQYYSLDEEVKHILTAYRNNVKGQQEFISKEAKEKLHYPIHSAKVELIREKGLYYTNYDGLLSQPSLLYPDKEKIYSASKLNAYAQCPFKYFAQNILKISIENLGMDEKLGIGSFYHEVLKEYHTFKKGAEVADHELLDEIIDGLKNSLSIITMPQPYIAFYYDYIYQCLHDFIDLDAENMKRYLDVQGKKLVPTYLEKTFTFVQGENVFKGKIDRIDLEVNEAGQYTGKYIVYDYKMKGIKELKQSIDGQDFQLSLYQRATEKILLEELKMKSECIALLYYSIEHLEWKGWIQKDYKKSLFESRKGPRSVMAKENMEATLKWTEVYLASVIESINAGKFIPPKECPSTFFGCEYESLCRYNRIRLEMKKEGPSC